MPQLPLRIVSAEWLVDQMKKPSEENTKRHDLSLGCERFSSNVNSCELIG